MTVWRPLTQMRDALPPPKVRRGKEAYFELEDGRRILNCVSSWWFTLHGHGDEELARAIYEQALLIEHINFADFTHEKAEQLSREVLELVPPSLFASIFSDSGSTAVEIALKVALQYWSNLGQPERTLFIRFNGGYHGDTLGSMSVGKDAHFHRPFLSLLFNVLSVPFPATWEGDESVDEKEAAALQILESLLTQHSPRCAGLIIEPLIQGASGMRVCRPCFLPAVEKLAKSFGLLVIYDEVMTGFGRTGDWFAASRCKTSPDLLCLAKGLSGGYLPVALTLASKSIYEAFFGDDLDRAFLHSHTFGGSALGCAVALASLARLRQNAASFQRMEEWHKPYLQDLARIPGVHRPRLMGTMAAVDIQSPHYKSAYGGAFSERIKQRLLERGFYFRPIGSTVYFLPPYSISKDDLASAYAALGTTIEELVLHG